jgi:hypothetical protein
MNIDALKSGTVIFLASLLFETSFLGLVKNFQKKKRKKKKNICVCPLLHKIFDA